MTGLFAFVTMLAFIVGYLIGNIRGQDEGMNIFFAICKECRKNEKNA